MLRPLSPRRWVAWRLVCLAHRLYDATFYERIQLRNGYGDVVAEVCIEGDEYGAGVWSVFGEGKHPPFTLIHDEFNTFDEMMGE